MDRDRPVPGDDASEVDARFFELSLDHLCVAGFDGYWKRLNRAWTETLGWTEAELMAAPVIEFVHPDDREVTLAARARLHDGTPLRKLINRYRRKDGTYCWFEWRSVSDPRRQLVFAIARDVTAEQEALRALAELTVADRMASVGALAAGIAHEVNNPLAAVVTNLDLLAEELAAAAAPGSRAVEWLEMVRDARAGADRIRAIVRRLKPFARTPGERRAVIELAPVLDRAVELAAHELAHARVVRAYGDAPRVDADEARLAQVFVNLLVNAAQAVAGAAGDEIRIALATAPTGDAVVEVLDTGPGIPADVLPRVFDPFVTTRPIGAGSGLGLSICHSVVTGLGGQITAANRPGGGTVVRLTLPAAPAPEG